jgi:hypothetical protein
MCVCLWSEELREGVWERTLCWDGDTMGKNLIVRFMYCVIQGKDMMRRDNGGVKDKARMTRSIAYVTVTLPHHLTTLIKPCLTVHSCIYSAIKYTRCISVGYCYIKSQTKGAWKHVVSPRLALISLWAQPTTWRDGHFGPELPSRHVLTSLSASPYPFHPT